MADAISSLFQSTIDTVSKAAGHYSTVKDDEGLPDAFHEAGRGLHAVRQALIAAKSHFSLNLAQSTTELLGDCKTKAELSEKVFKDVAVAPEHSTFQHYKAAVRQQGKGNTVEVLTVGMMKDVCELAKDDEINSAMGDQVKVLQDGIRKLASMEPSVPKEEGGNIFNAFGGEQFNAVGGTQNIAKGDGNLFPGASFGTVTFSQLPPGGK